MRASVPRKRRITGRLTTLNTAEPGGKYVTPFSRLHGDSSTNHGTGLPCSGKYFWRHGEYGQFGSRRSVAGDDIQGNSTGRFKRNLTVDLCPAPIENGPAAASVLCYPA